MAIHVQCTVYILARVCIVRGKLFGVLEDANEGQFKGLYTSCSRSSFPLFE